MCIPGQKPWENKVLTSNWKEVVGNRSIVELQEWGPAPQNIEIYWSNLRKSLCKMVVVWSWQKICRENTNTDISSLNISVIITHLQSLCIYNTHHWVQLIFSVQILHKIINMTIPVEANFYKWQLQLQLQQGGQQRIGTRTLEPTVGIQWFYVFEYMQGLVLSLWNF